MKITGDQLTALINLAFESADRSKVGPVMTPGPTGAPVFNTLAYDAFRISLQNLIPNVTLMESTAECTVKEAREDWQT